MNDEQQPQHLVVETDEEKERRFTEAKPYFVELIASFEPEMTQEEFSKKWNIAESTLSQWKKQQWFKDAYIKAIESNMVVFLKDAYSQMKTNMKNGDFNSLKLILAQLEVLKAEKKEKQDTNITVNLVPGYGITTTTVGSTSQTGGDTPASSEIQGS